MTGTTEEQIGFAEADDILGVILSLPGTLALHLGIRVQFDAGTIADPWVCEYYGVYSVGYTVSPTISSPWQTAMAYTSIGKPLPNRNYFTPWDPNTNSFRGAVTKLEIAYVFPYTTKITSGSTYQMAIATQSVFMEPPSGINNSEAVFDFVDHFDGT